jgi:hypothetical protein
MPRLTSAADRRHPATLAERLERDTRVLVRFCIRKRTSRAAVLDACRLVLTLRRGVRPSTEQLAALRVVMEACDGAPYAHRLVNPLRRLRWCVDECADGGAALVADDPGWDRLPEAVRRVTRWDRRPRADA